MAKSRVSPNELAWANLLLRLVEGRASRYSLAEASGLDYTTVCSRVRLLRKKKLIHRDGMAKDEWGRSAVETFKFGKGEDAPRKL